VGGLIWSSREPRRERNRRSQRGGTAFPGSRLLGFRCKAALGQDQARALAKELAALYAKSPPTAADDLARLLAGRDWLLLRYTES